MVKEEILSVVAENIRIERLRKRYTQEQLAEKAGITAKYLNSIENAKVNPSIVIIVNICLALGLKLNEIYKI